MKQIDLTNVQEATDFKGLPAGPYICRITSAVDVPEKEYLKIGVDIAEGEFRGYYSKRAAEHPEWDWGSVGVYCRSYKEKALGMFKRFCSSVSKSNGNFVFDGGTVNSDEKSLVGKMIGIVFQEEEYYGNDGEKKTRLIINKEFPVSDLSAQKVPKKKELPPDESTVANAGTSDDIDEIPFNS